LPISLLWEYGIPSEIPHPDAPFSYAPFPYFANKEFRPELFIIIKKCAKTRLPIFSFAMQVWQLLLEE
jgi:hypothetical protein